MTPPILDAEWSSGFVNVWSDLDENLTNQVTGYVYSSYSELCTMSLSSMGGQNPTQLHVVDNYTSNVANVMNVTGQTCSITPTEGDIFEAPDILQVCAVAR